MRCNAARFDRVSVTFTLHTDAYIQLLVIHSVTNSFIFLRESVKMVNSFI